MSTIVCPNCGASNRIDEEKIRSGSRPICGRCKTPLPVDNRPLVVTDSTFSAIVEQSPLPVLVDMWAEWCGPCHMLAPVIDSLTRELAGKIRIGKLNVDENPRTASRFSIQGIPALLIFKNGREVDRIVGAQPKQEILRKLQPYL